MACFRPVTSEGIGRRPRVAVAVAVAYTGEESTRAVMKVVSHVIKSVPVKRGDPFYILYQVNGNTVQDLAGRIEADPKNSTTLRRVRNELISESSEVKTIDLKDLHKLHNFPGWRWKDVQRELYNIKKTEVLIRIYCEKDGALHILASDLGLTDLYLTGDTESDDIHRNHGSGLTVTTATDMFGTINNTQPVAQSY
ncbi:uncharacterized protein LOC133923801 [Phragmites australis]|uniref:uncharacterized protein LOC133923801 n=1 Tax=Phragmites australis TaxID=29695 RepID=UPI002D79F1A7|nr:uncharacterized protein LOC133923801 [Phragmites australis]